VYIVLLPPSIAIISSPSDGISVTKKGKYRTPKANFKTLVKKSNNIRNRGTPLVIFHESLDPPLTDFGKNFRYPFSWIFNLCAFMFELVSFQKEKIRRKKNFIDVCTDE
jgi:hypothetical protein